MPDEPETQTARKTRPRPDTSPPAKADPETFVAAKRIADINKVLDHQWNGRANVAGVVEVAANLFCRLRGWPNNFGAWASRRASSWSRAQLDALVDDVRTSFDSFNPWQVGQLLQLSEITRLRLKITHIRPFDLSTAEIDQSRREAKRLKDAERRRTKGAKPQSESEARRKPWEEIGVSRAAFYRMKRNRTLPDPETEKRPLLKVTNIERETVSKRNGSGAPEARLPQSPVIDFIAERARRDAIAAWAEERPRLIKHVLELTAILLDPDRRAGQ